MKICEFNQGEPSYDRRWAHCALLLVLFAIVLFPNCPWRLSAESLPQSQPTRPIIHRVHRANHGTGFQPGEQVQCQVLRLDAPFDLSVSHLPWLVTADASGNFLTSWFVTWDAAGAMLELTAVGQTSSVGCDLGIYRFINSSNNRARRGLRDRWWPSSQHAYRWELGIGSQAQPAPVDSCWTRRKSNQSLVHLASNE